MASIYPRVSPYLEGTPADVPPVDLDSPEVICRGWVPENSLYLVNGQIYFSKEKAINGPSDEDAGD